MDTLLETAALSVAFGLGENRLRVVHDVSLRVGRGEIVALVGESGSGKSATAMALSRLNEGPRCSYSGAVLFKGLDVFSLDRQALRSFRTRAVSTIFQDPLSALNPAETIAAQIGEGLPADLRRTAVRRARIADLLAEVGIHDTARVARSYPHQLSGGQRQRVMIALALACDPELLIADEPTTALDVTVQAQVLAILYRAVRRRGMAVLLITHDMGVVAGMADRVAVMYGGRIVEEAPVEALFAAPRHPYTAALIECAGHARDAAGHYTFIPGVPAGALALRDVAGCAFAARCPHGTARCTGRRPDLAQAGKGRSLACHHPVATQAQP
jgi:peptide/nickel transport system ATP-binding protein